MGLLFSFRQQEGARLNGIRNVHHLITLKMLAYRGTNLDTKRGALHSFNRLNEVLLWSYYNIQESTWQMTVWWTKFQISVKYYRSDSHAVTSWDWLVLVTEIHAFVQTRAAHGNDGIFYRVKIITILNKVIWVALTFFPSAILWHCL